MPVAPSVRRRRTFAALGVVVGALLVAGCGTSGRTLRDPAPGATAPPRRGASTTATTTAASIGPAPAPAPVSGLSVVSPAWNPGGEIPVGYTCDGAATSPPLTIAGTSPETVELVLVVTDQDAGGLVHWSVAGIAPADPSFPQGSLPPGAFETVNGSGGPAWFPVCPPSGETHVYDVTVYALPAPSGLSAVSTPEQVDAVLATAVNVAAMTGSYTRP